MVLSEILRNFHILSLVVEQARPDVGGGAHILAHLQPEIDPDVHFPKLGLTFLELEERA